ncbi:MAG: cytochrome [Proteobacteria bacterium]|nr:cytochrome [Pseudomonadota bacterium]
MQYTRTAIWLHWLMAILIVATFVMGVSVANIEGLTLGKLKAVTIHKWMGITVLLLACLRLLWRLFHPAPPLPDSVPAWQQKAAHAVHALMYFLIFAVPLSGYLFSLAAGVPVVLYGIIPLPLIIEPNPELRPLLRSAHFWLNLTLLSSVLLHVAAALKHYFIDRDTVMQRMRPW